MPNSSADPEASTLRFGPMRARDLDAVAAIEATQFPTPWKRSHFAHELTENPFALTRVLRRGDRVVGYLCIWVIDGQIQLNKIAVDPTEQRCGLGRKMMVRLLQLARRQRCYEILLEVRPSNSAAIKLYQDFDFVEIDRRRDYYGPGNDGVVMRRVLLDAR